MPAGEAFTARQADDILRAIRLGESSAAMRIAVYVGELAGEPRPAAARLHAALGADVADAVLVAVDPGSRSVEIVTGATIARRLHDRDCLLATMSMTTAFSAGDLAGGIVNGVRALAEHARAPQSLHLDTP